MARPIEKSPAIQCPGSKGREAEMLRAPAGLRHARSRGLRFGSRINRSPKALPQGPIRCLGLSNSAAWRIAKSLGISALMAWQRFSSLHAYYAIVGRDLEREIVPMLSNGNSGSSCRTLSFVAGGVYLSGEYNDSGKGRLQDSYPEYTTARNSVIDVLHRYRTEIRLDGTLSHRVLFTSTRHDVILGTKQLTQLNEKLGPIESFTPGGLRSL